MRDEAAPDAHDELGSRVARINQVSAFVCRPRHGTHKLSEHALGNAIDIASFTLADGRSIEVKAGSSGTPEQKFLGEVRDAACGPFTTVLGPGTDPDHSLHFHFDLEERHNASTYCR